MSSPVRQSEFAPLILNNSYQPTPQGYGISIPVPSAPPQQESVQHDFSHYRPNKAHAFTFDLQFLRANHHLNIKLGDREKQIILTDYLAVQKAVKSNVNEMQLRAYAIETKLQMAGLIDDSNKRASYIADAKKNVGYLLEQDYFNPWGHYCQFLVHAYEGIDCSDMEIVKQALLCLRRAIRLDLSEELFKKTLENASQTIQLLFGGLESGGHIDSALRAQLALDFAEIKAIDPFQEVLEKNSALLKKAPSGYNGHLSSAFCRKITPPSMDFVTLNGNEHHFPGYIDENTVKISTEENASIEAASFNFIDLKRIKPFQWMNIVYTARLVSIIFENGTLVKLIVSGAKVSSLTKKGITYYLLKMPHKTTQLVDKTVALTKPKEYLKFVDQFDSLIERKTNT